MANTNFSDDGKQKTFKEEFCLEGISAGIHNQLIFFSVLNIVLSNTAFVGNILILVALHKETSLHPSSKLLYRTLATTDLCVGIIVEPFYAAYLLSVANEGSNICRHVVFDAFLNIGVILCSVSLFTLTAISVDRLLALLLWLRYRQVVTLKRTYLAVTVFWVVSIVGTAMYFWNPVITGWYIKAFITLCLVTSIVSYTKIFLTLRHRQIRVQDNIHQEQPNQGIPMNIARYKKAVSSALWVQLALVVCYLPYGIMVAWMTKNEISLSTGLALFNKVTTTLVFFNSSLNPALYCWKMKEVRQAVKDTIGQICSSFC